MRYNYFFTEKAENDLDGIIKYISVNLANKSAAQNFFVKVFENVETICAYPETGKPLALQVAGVAERCVCVGLAAVGKAAEAAPGISESAILQQLAQGLRIVVAAGCPAVWVSLAHVSVSGIFRDVSL